MKLKVKKGSFFGLAIFSTAIICPIAFDSVKKAQAQSNCYMVNSSDKVTNLSGVCSPNNAEEIFQIGRELDAQGQHQQAIAEYTRAIQIDPNHAEAYIFRGNALALENQPLKGIEDAQRAIAIYNFRGDSVRASMVQQLIQTIQQGIRNGEF